MAESVAVNHFFTSLSMQILKREALMFDLISIPHLSEILVLLQAVPNTDTSSAIAEYEWLCSQGILIETKHDANAKISDKEYRQVLAGAKRDKRSLEKILQENNLGEFTKVGNEEFPGMIGKAVTYMTENLGEVEKVFTSEGVITNMAPAYDKYARCIAIELRKLKGLDAYPILVTTPQQTIDSPVNNVRDVIEFVLKEFPIPDENTPWEQIIEFRSDPSSRSKYLALRKWMNTISRSNLTKLEIEQEYEYLVDQYQQEMRLHNMKTNTGVLKIVVVSGSELLENVAKLKLGNIGRSFFAFRERKIELLDAELHSPQTVQAATRSVPSTLSHTRHRRGSHGDTTLFHLQGIRFQERGVSRHTSRTAQGIRGRLQELRDFPRRLARRDVLLQAGAARHDDRLPPPPRSREAAQSAPKQGGAAANLPRPRILLGAPRSVRVDSEKLQPLLCRDG